MRLYSISPSRCINTDQTRMLLIPSGNERTYEVKGAKDVGVIDDEEKLAFTAVIGCAADGYIIPLQTV